MQLASITLSGTMTGTYWQDLYAEDAGQSLDFDLTFAPPHAPHSPWQTEWRDLREALIEALSSGDLVGQTGAAESVAITFHMGDGKGRLVSVTKELRHGAGGADLWN